MRSAEVLKAIVVGAETEFVSVAVGVVDVVFMKTYVQFNLLHLQLSHIYNVSIIFLGKSVF